jgi:ketosteroid isomerase-like protein
MVRPLLAHILIFIVAAVPQIGTATGAQDVHDLEDHIWALEDAYVTAYQHADHEAILALMHKRFLGWPDSEERPTAYPQVPGFLKKNYGAPGTWSFSIDRAGIRIDDDVAITHYLLLVSAKAAADSSQAQVTRITHTWVRGDAGWKIFGGMSNVP